MKIWKKKINTLEKELNEEKNKNKMLEGKIEELNKELSDKIKNLEKAPGNAFDSKKELYKIIFEKDKELKELKLELLRYPIKLKEGEKLMTVNITTPDSSIQNYSILCKNTDIFNNIEKTLYEDYKDYYETNNFFTVNGLKINRFKSLEDNKIHNNDVILLNVIEW